MVNSLFSDHSLKSKYLLYKAVLALLFMGALITSYKLHVVPQYAYMGYKYFSPSIVALIVNMMMIAFVATQMPDSVNKPSDIFVWFFLVVVIIPSLSIPLVSVNKIGGYSLFAAQVTFALSFLVVVWISNIKIQIIDLPYLNERLFYGVLFSFFLIIFLSMYLDYGFDPKRLFSLESLAELYGIRLEQREAMATASVISLYGMSWLTKLLIPMLIVINLRKNRRIWAAIFVLAQLLIFTVSVQKSFILTLVITYFVYRLVSKQPERAGFRFFYSVSLFTFGAFLIFILTNNGILIDVFVRRALIVPGMLSGYYIEFFDINGLAMYSQNFLRSIFDTSYNVAPAFIIGEEYFGRPDLRANVNFLADSFGNIGNLGVFFNSLILGVILLLFNIFSVGKDMRIVIPSLCGVAWSFCESPFVTSLFTHGVVIALIMVALLPKKNEHKSIEY